MKRVLSGIFASPLLIVAGLGTPFAVEAADTGLPADTAAAILQELKAIRQLLEKIEQQGNERGANRPAAPRTAKVSIEGKPAMGAEDAPVTVVEFADYQCPFCLRFTRDTFPTLKQKYIDTGKVRWVALNLPLPFHKDARKAAQAALCAGEQGKFWEMREILFRHPQQLGMAFLPQHAKTLSLDIPAFMSCLQSNRHFTEIDRDAKDAGSVRLTGTPSFIIGHTASKEITGEVVVGARPLKVFETAITKALQQN